MLLIFDMNTADFTHKLIGKYIYIDKIDFPLTKLIDFFSVDDLSFIFGEKYNEDNYLGSIENSRWHTHLLFRLNSTNKVVGYLELIKVGDEVELHGGGTNNSFIEKIARTEAWYLIIKYCFDTFNIKSLNTKCWVKNQKAFNLITGTGFKVIGKSDNGDCFKFNLSLEDFHSNRIFKMIDQLIKNQN